LAKTDAANGTWTLTTTVKTTAAAGQIGLSSLKDILVIDAKTKDIGGNVAETGCSWLIQSDKLQLMRISNEMDDDTYSRRLHRLFFHTRLSLYMGRRLEQPFQETGGHQAYD